MNSAPEEAKRPCVPNGFPMEAGKLISWLVVLLLLLPLSCSVELHSPPTAAAVLTPLAVPTSTAVLTEMAPTLESVTPSALPQSSPVPRATASPTPLPIGEQPPLRTQYALSAQLDYARHHLAVTQAITYVNRCGEPLPDLLLVVEPNRQQGVFRLRSLNWADGQTIEDYILEGARLRVPLAQPLSPGAAVRLSLSFEIDLPAQHRPFGYTARQANLGDWYPFVPPYRGDHGWVVHEPAAAGEHLVYDVADFEVDIHLLDPPPGLLIASSTLGERSGDRYHHRLVGARGFAWSASPGYVVLQTAAGSVAVTGYVFPEHKEAGEAAVGISASALALYAELFGPYPHASLAVVEADFPDGMEYDGLYFLGQAYFAAYDGDPKGYLTALAAHEIAHQWWYGVVGNDQAIEPWLDEALAAYSEALFYERFYPDLVDWWWTFRVTSFDPAGWVNSTIYDHPRFRPYVDAVYLRGALFMQDLREMIGEEAFSTFLQDYVARGAGRQVTAGDFFAVLAQHSPANTEELARIYFSPQR
jgi:hypothetical protein